jgi:hypothetical protein
MCGYLFVRTLRVWLADPASRGRRHDSDALVSLRADGVADRLAAFVS